MIRSFFKYHGAANDFIILDGRDGEIDLKQNTISNLCSRHTGIGADGLMILKKDEKSNFFMDFYNSDGKPGSMCGNGGRCIVAFADYLRIVEKEILFRAPDGLHEAEILSRENFSWKIKLKMKDVEVVNEIGDNIYYLNTGSPHVVVFTKDIDTIDVKKAGAEIRYNPMFPEGTNVNFIEEKTYGLLSRTYERGVEDETLACGTGATASAIAWAHKTNKTPKIVTIKARGGILDVKFAKSEGIYKDVWLEGGAQMVYRGEINIM